MRADSTARGVPLFPRPQQPEQSRSSRPSRPDPGRARPGTRTAAGSRTTTDTLRARAAAGSRPFPRRRAPLPYRRLLRLYAGLALFGASGALVIRGDLGLDPWDVFHQGLSRHTGISIGNVSIVVGAAVLLLWWPIRQRPGIGTVSNVFLVGAFIDLTMAVVPHYEALGVRIPLLVAGVVLNGAATGLYITARFGPGPRDGLMTGLHRRTGRSMRLIRTGIELTVLAGGFALGGGVGVGTVLYAVTIGPLAQFFLRLFALPGGPRDRQDPSPHETGPHETGQAGQTGHTEPDGITGGVPSADADRAGGSEMIRREAPQGAAVDTI
jgi:uncharacterized membrane protein YczE